MKLKLCWKYLDECCQLLRFYVFTIPTIGIAFLGDVSYFSHWKLKVSCWLEPGLQPASLRGQAFDLWYSWWPSCRRRRQEILFSLMCACPPVCCVGLQRWISRGHSSFSRFQSLSQDTLVVENGSLNIRVTAVSPTLTRHIWARDSLNSCYILKRL